MAEPQDKLHEHRDWLRVTLSSIGDAVISTDTGGLVTFLNPVAESLTGWTLGSAIGQPLDSVFKIVNQQTRNTVESPTVRALRDGVIVGLANHTLLIAKDGTERPIDDSAAPIRNDKGEIAGVVLVFRDITERHRQEQHLQDARIYADNIIATLREPFVVLDGSLRVRTANRSFYQNFHVTPEETEGSFIFDLGNGQWNIPGLRTALDEVLADHHPVLDFDVEHEFPAIGKRNMLLNARRVQSVNSQPDLILLAIEDTTERKQAEVAVQTSEVRYRRLFETAKDGILILDANTLQIIDANPYMAELLGYTHDEFMGKELWEIGLFKDKQASRSVYHELQKRGYIRYDNLPLENSRGEKVEVEFVSNIYQVDHRPIAQCNIRDISERSRLEKKLKEQAKALADLHSRKDEFLAMLSHELRNPLAAIASATHILRLQDNEDQLQHQARAIIERQLGQLTRLVDDLLEVSRITSGRVQLRQDRVVVSSIVERAVETARPLINQNKHELTVSLPRDPIWLYADAARLEQVVVNLLTNAAKYTDDGGHVWLTVEQQGDECVLIVRDTGVGIAPELLPRIFDLFTQAERSLDRSHGGLGIGLALVQRLVELHQGRVEVHSSLGKGSEFVVHLPLSLTPVPIPNLPTEQSLRTGPSLRVVVVDDNCDTAMGLSLVLQAMGHDVRTANDGVSALETIRNHKPRVVFLDIGLPGLNGYDVARRIREQPGLTDAVLIAVTGYGQESDRQHSRDAGFDHHWVKPLDFGNLNEMLSRVVPDAS